MHIQTHTYNDNQTSVVPLQTFFSYLMTSSALSNAHGNLIIIRILHENTPRICGKKRCPLEIKRNWRVVILNLLPLSCNISCDHTRFFSDYFQSTMHAVSLQKVHNFKIKRGQQETKRSHRLNPNLHLHADPHAALQKSFLWLLQCEHSVCLLGHFAFLSMQATFSCSSEE